MVSRICDVLRCLRSGIRGAVQEEFRVRELCRQTERRLLKMSLDIHTVVQRAAIIRLLWMVDSQKRIILSDASE